MQKDNIEKIEKIFTISEFRHELDIPLVFAKKLISWGLIGAEVAVDGTFRITETELLKAREILKNPWKKLYLYWKSLGPGLITGASDDDPSGIATYSSVGAQFGLALLWMSAWLLPMMMAIQEVCARIGIVTNQGLAGVLRKHYKKSIVSMVVVLLIVANIANIGADLGAMASSLKLLVNINYIVASAGFAGIIILLEIFVSYKSYSQILKWLSLVLLAYVVTAIIIHPDWFRILKEAIRPQIQFSKGYVFAMIAFFGTTITPYLFFWQASEEVEETANEVKDSKHRKQSVIKRQIVRMRNDVKSGMIFSNIVALFIVVTAAQVLFKNGITNIGSAEQAAMALKPLAGNYAFLLFTAGIVGMGIMAVPILAGACAYALAEVMNWDEGLSKRFSEARAFYIVIVLSVIIGLLLNFVGINPITALYYAAWLNGVIALPLMAVIMIVGNNEKIMGREIHPGWVKFFGWFAVIGMLIALLATALLHFGPFTK